MSRPAIAALDRLRQARGPDDPDERHELREEVRITSLLLISQELEFISDALTKIAASVDAYQLRVDRLLHPSNTNGAPARPGAPLDPES